MVLETESLSSFFLIIIGLLLIIMIYVSSKLLSFAHGKSPSKREMMDQNEELLRILVAELLDSELSDEVTASKNSVDRNADSDDIT
jgi:hypothetical protein